MSKEAVDPAVRASRQISAVATPMAFPWNDDSKNADADRKSSRGGRRQGACPWAQDDDEDMFQRGPPSSRGPRANRTNLNAAPAPLPRTPYKPETSGAPWAADHQLQWDKPSNSYGAGLGVPAAPPYESYGGDDMTRAEPLPDESDYGYTSQSIPSMPIGRSPMRGGGAAPWALDSDEPMMSVSQAAFRSGGRTSAPPSRGNGPTLSAKEMKAKMQGAGNLLSWN